MRKLGVIIHDTPRRFRAGALENVVRDWVGAGHGVIQ